MTARTAVVLGAAGAVGRSFADRLRAEGIAVVGVDLRGQRPAARLSRICWDATVPHASVSQAVQNAECVLVCLPESAALASLSWWADALRPGTLIVDTLSAKPRFAERAAALAPLAERLGINPLFAPDLPFEERTVAVVSTAGGPRTDWFVGLLKQWRLILAEVTLDEHDRAMALVQALTHAVVLAFGCALRECAYDASALAPLRTPPHALLLCLLARMLQKPPEAYFEIQRATDYAATARAALFRGLQQVATAVGTDDPVPFTRLLCDLRGIVAAELEPLSEMARTTFEFCKNSSSIA